MPLGSSIQLVLLLGFIALSLVDALRVGTCLQAKRVGSLREFGFWELPDEAAPGAQACQQQQPRFTTCRQPALNQQPEQEPQPTEQQLPPQLPPRQAQSEFPESLASIAASAGGGSAHRVPDNAEALPDNEEVLPTALQGMNVLDCEPPLFDALPAGTWCSDHITADPAGDMEAPASQAESDNSCDPGLQSQRQQLFTHTPAEDRSTSTQDNSHQQDSDSPKSLDPSTGLPSREHVQSQPACTQSPLQKKFREYALCRTLTTFTPGRCWSSAGSSRRQASTGCFHAFKEQHAAEQRGGCSCATCIAMVVAAPCRSRTSSVITGKELLLDTVLCCLHL